MRRAVVLLGALLCAVQPAPGATTQDGAAPPAWAAPAAPVTAPATPDDTALPPAVTAALGRAGLPRDALSVVLVDAQGGAPRISHRAAASVNPASVMKLVTTYAALDLLGPSFAWQTPVLFDGRIDANGVLRGDLVLRGRGDPKLVIERLWLLLRRVRAEGINAIDGDIVIDRGAFSIAAPDAAAFDGEPYRPYNAAPDALLVNFKTLTLTLVPDAAAGVARVLAEPPLAGVEIPATVPLAAPTAECGDWRAGLKADFSDALRVRFAGIFPAACGEKAWPVAYAAPDAYAGRAIEGVWRSMGGTLSGRVRDGVAGPSARLAFTAVSPPLAEVVRDINKYSNNVMAQQLFLTLSLQARGRASFEASREIVDQWWRDRLGSTLPLPVPDNGAGLSRTARITAGGLSQMLQKAWASPLMPDFVASLPAAGVDGTLRSRNIPGAAHLKTGSLRDVAAVAGYVHGPGARRWILVAIVNHPSAAAARPVFDALIDHAARP